MEKHTPDDEAVTPLDNRAYLKGKSGVQTEVKDALILLYSDPKRGLEIIEEFSNDFEPDLLLLSYLATFDLGMDQIYTVLDSHLPGIIEAYKDTFKLLNRAIYHPKPVSVKEKLNFFRN